MLLQNRVRSLVTYNFETDSEKATDLSDSRKAALLP